MNQTRRLIAFMLTVFMLSSLFILPVEVHAAYPPIEDRPQESGSDDNGNGRYDIINTRNVTGEDIINEAKTWLGQGATYWSGTSPWPDCVTWRMGFPKSDGSIHFDCSGFVSRVLNDCGLRCDEWHCNYGSSLLTERYGDNYLSTNLNYQRLYGIDIDAEVQRAKNGDWSGMVPGDIITFVSSNNHVLFYAGQNENGQPMTIEVYGNGNYDCVRYGVCFSNYPQYFEHGARLVVPGYLANCTPYPSYCTLRITDPTCKIKSLPCSVNTDPSSETVEVPSVGDTYTAVRLYKNTAGNYWYQVNCKNGKTGYLYADDCAYVSSSFSDVSGSNINVPTSLTVGSSFPVRGTVSTSYNNISKVSVYVYPGSATSGTAETGDEESVDTQSYNLQRLDNNVVFGVLPVGTHNYVVKATTYGYYATGPKTATTKSSTTIVKQQTFSVVSGSQPDPTITITFDPNGGTCSTGSKTITAGSAIGDLPTATRDGYTFDGWYTAASGGTQVTASTTFSTDTTIYAHWTLITYNVSVRPNGGSWPNGSSDPSGQYAPGSKINLPTPVRTGYQFVGWALSSSGTGHILEPWGVPKHSDPFFTQTKSDITVYNNLSNGNVTVDRVAKSNDCPTSSAYMLKVTTAGKAAPQLGGFIQGTYSKASGVFYHVILAKIPVGYKIERASNECGDGAQHIWLTSQQGTGEFETYIYKTTCGTTGTFSTFGHVYLSGSEATSGSPVTWYVGYSEVFDGTGVSSTGNTYTVGNGSGTLVALWNEIKYDVSIWPNGGSWPSGYSDPSGRYAPGSKINLTAPIRDGYQFMGWALASSGTGHVLEPWGVPMHSDPFFTLTKSDIYVYNNLQNGNVTVDKVEKSSDCPTSSAYMLKITTSGEAAPLLGGFVQLTYPEASGVYYHVILAKIPVGYTIARAANIYGNDNEFTWLTSQKGTGEFETYIYKTVCGTTGTFDNFGHVYLSGPEATADSPVTWYVGYSEVFDATGVSITGNTYTVGNGSGTLVALWKEIKYDVRIELMGGEWPTGYSSQDGSYKPGSKINLATPERDGYNFAGWALAFSGTGHILEPWGVPTHSDPFFTQSMSDIYVYNNLKNGNVTIEKVEKASDCPTASAYMLKITTSGEAAPLLGGFVQFSYPEASGVYYHVILAKIPVGYNIVRAANIYGEENEFTWLTSQKGTGEFETYIYKTVCGTTGTFDNFGHVYLSGPEATEASPVTWYVGYSEVFDATNVPEGNSYTMGNGNGYLYALWNKNCSTGHSYGSWAQSNAPTCTEAGEETRTCIRCGDIETREIVPLGHDWNEPNYIWADDNSSVTAIRTCSRNASHVETETVSTTFEVTKEATYEEEGEITYTATFENTAFVTQTKAVATPKLVKPDDGLPCDGGDDCPGNKFTDMPAKGHWAHDAIDWAIVKGVTSGTSETTFSPNKTCTRAQVVTFLWRAYGEPEPTTTGNPFTDVRKKDYFYKAVLWAVEKGITNGTSGTTFGPNKECTRGQVATFLWRAAGEPEPTTTDNPFTDVRTKDYFYKAVMWAVENGITNGTSGTTFSPNKICNRGQVVTFLYRDLA